MPAASGISPRNGSSAVPRPPAPPPWRRSPPAGHSGKHRVAHVLHDPQNQDLELRNIRMALAATSSATSWGRTISAR
jgi:hypothetical protein